MRATATALLLAINACEPPLRRGPPTAVAPATYQNGSASDPPRTLLTTEPEYWIRKCHQGDGNVCYLVGANFERGDQGTWGYFAQDDTKAAEFYRAGCELGN